VDEATLERQFVQQFELQPDIAWKGRFSAPDRGRYDEQAEIRRPDPP